MPVFDFLGFGLLKTDKWVQFEDSQIADLIAKKAGKSVACYLGYTRGELVAMLDAWPVPDIKNP